MNRLIQRLFLLCNSLLRSPSAAPIQSGTPIVEEHEDWEIDWDDGVIDWRDTAVALAPVVLEPEVKADVMRNFEQWTEGENARCRERMSAERR